MARGVAEMALALTLNMVRRIPAYASEMRDGVVRTNEEVEYRRELVWSQSWSGWFRSIGRAFAKLINPFDVQLLVSDPYAQPDAIADQGESLVDLDDLVARAQ